MLKTEIEAAIEGAEPWFNTNKNWPAELTATPIGLEHTPGLQTGVGESAVPMGASTPATWSTVKPETVLEVSFGT
jgi:hypothetical protein